MARQPVSRLRLRHPLVPVLVLVRAGPSLDARVCSAAGDLGLPRARRGRAGRPRHILFEREVAEARWDEGRARWRLRCRSGETIDARILVVAVGALSTPEIPPLRGVERFRGARFHSARWDPTYDLRGKRVAVIGTGASAVQFVPHVQPLVAKLHVFQRTAPWIIPRHDRAFGPWTRRILRYVPGARWLYRQLLYWRHEGRVLAFVRHTSLMRLVAWQARRHMERSIRDPALRDVLTPRYQPGCKRILLSDDYYPALAQSNVEVVTDAIEEVEEEAIRVAGGRRIEVDAILYGTGFRVHDYLCGLEILGRGSERLRALWGEGAEAYLGTLVAGFPNLFVMTGPNSGLGHNSMLLIMEAQARYLGHAAALLRHGRATSVEVRRDAQDAYNAWVRGRNAHSVWASGCRSWYLDARGRNTTLWPGAALSFRLRTARLRPEDLELRRTPGAGE